VEESTLFFISIAVAFIVGVFAGRVSKSTPEDYGPPDGAPARLNPVRDVTTPGCKVLSLPVGVKPSHSWPGRVTAQRAQSQREQKSVVESGDVA
jgi:hypothetical protein